MHRLLFTLGPLRIHWYGVLMALGFLAGMVNWIILGKREGRDARFSSDLLFWIMISGIVGARVAFVVANYRSFGFDLLSIVRIDKGGLIYYGGFLASTIAIVWFAHKHRMSVIKLLDFVITSVPLGHAFGRVGCLMNGCCYGKVYNGWPSIRFPHDSDPWFHHVMARLIDSEAVCSRPVHPVQLYEAGFNLLIYIVLLRVFLRRRADGEVTGLYLTFYPAGRFFFEFLRVPTHPPFLGITPAQALSVALFAVGIVFYVRARRAGRRWKTS